MSKLLTTKEVCDRVKLCRQQLWKLERQGKFPKRIPLTEGPRAKKVWREDEIEAWIESRGRGFIGRGA